MTLEKPFNRYIVWDNYEGAHMVAMLVLAKVSLSLKWLVGSFVLP